MRLSHLARRLGRRGGQARARRLSAERRKAIAAQGGVARRESLAAARRIDDNFAYAEAVETLRGGRPAIERLADFDGPLPTLARS